MKIPDGNGGLIDEDDQKTSTTEIEDSPGHPNVSKAAYSAIATPETDAKSAVLGLVNDVNQQREEIDRLNESMRYIADELQKTNTAVNKIWEHIQGNNTNSSTAITPNGQQQPNIESLANVLEKISPVLDRIWPKNEGPQPLISQEVINTKMQQAFFDNLDTGESINNYVKNTLKKKVTQKVINESFKEIGQAGGLDPHAPQ